MAVAFVATMWGCLPGTGGSSGAEGCYVDDWTGAATMVDCGKAAMCSFGRSACDCDMSGCVADGITAIPFDFHVVGVMGDGSVMLDVLHNVHLTKTR